MEKPLSFVLKLSLEEMALRRVVIHLWNGADILDSIEELLNDEIPDNEYREPLQVRLDKQNEEWRATVENEVKAKISELVLPESLKKRMMQIVRPIGLQIKDWKRLEAYLSGSREYLDMGCLEELCWTSAGAIDYQKMAGKIVRLEKFDAVTRYRWACLFCLADSIPVLWEELPQDHKRCFLDETVVYRVIDMEIEFYWSYVLKGDESKLDGILRRFFPDSNISFNQYAFGISAVRGNKAASEYFFQKLTCKERDDCLIRTVYDVALKRCDPDIGCNRIYGVPNIRFYVTNTDDTFKFLQRNISDVLCYLLSVMSPEQQMQVFKTQSVMVLPCFLDWPCHDLFLDVADLVWTFIPEIDCSVLAIYINKNLRNQSYYFPNLIQKFFLRSPSHFRNAFLWNFLSWFSEFSDAEDTEAIKLTFRNVDPEDKATLDSCDWFLRLLKVLMKTNKWHFVELWIREAAVSKEDRERLEESINTYVLGDFEGEELRLVRCRLKRYFQLLEETEASAPNKGSSKLNH